MRFTQEHETRTVVNGQEYHAQSAPDRMCNGCAFDRAGPNTPCCYSTPAVVAATPCTPHQRADRSSIIWVKA